MARDYKKEYEKSKEWNIQSCTLTIRLPKTMAEDFIAKVELEGVTKSTKIKELIENYTYGEK